MSGQTTLQASLEPPDAASAVIFFVDGRQIVRRARRRHSSATGTRVGAITEHQIRIVATLAAGGRVVQTLRTKGVKFADNEDVDAVQVTVTVMDGPDRYVRGLPLSAFRVFEDGRPQTISYFANSNVPLELIAAHRHQRQHGPGDAEAEAGGAGVSRCRCRPATR